MTAVDAAAFNAEFGKRLCTVRRVLGKTDAEAATAMGVTLRTYQRYERGCAMRGGHRQMVQYAGAWGVSFRWLLEGRGAMFKSKAKPAVVSNIVQLAEADCARTERQEAEFRALLAMVPGPVAIAFMLAVRDQSEEPFEKLPPKWRNEVY